MDAQELARWTRFASKGGIGKCTATKDCVAQNPEDLMFLQDDEIVVLMQVSASDNLYLGFCEGVVGKFSGADVRFHGKLKKPIITRRPGSVTAFARASPVPSGHPVVPSPTPSDPSSLSPFHLDRTDNETDTPTIEPGQSEQSHSHDHDGPSSSPTHGRTSRPHTRASSAADKSPESDSSSVETPARPSEEQQSSPLAIEVVDESGHLSQPLPHQLPHNPAETSGDGAKSSTTLDKPLVPSSREEVASATCFPSSLDVAQASLSNGEEAGVVPNQLRIDALSPTRSSQDDKPASGGANEEPYSPSSGYTKEEGGLASEDSHIQRSSAAVSDGGFGIGLSLLQGLANGERDSRAWSESEADDLSLPPRSPNVVIPNAPSQPAGSPDPSANSTADNRASTISSYSFVDGGSQRHQSESEQGDSGYNWDDDDLLEDYRYSRYSVVSKMSKQSRSSIAPSIARSSRVPPMPDDRRPSMDGQRSTRSASTSSPPPSFASAKPLNIVKNSSKVASSSASPTASVLTEQDRSTPLGMASAMRQRIDEENEKDSLAVIDRGSKSEELTPKPSSDNLRQQPLTTESPSSSTVDRNGDGSDIGSVQEAEMPPNPFNDPFSPVSTTGSTSSIFLPHPGAPKPVMNNAGQITPRPAAIHIATAAAASAAYESSTSPLASPEAPRHASNENSTTTSMPSIPTVMSLISTLRMAAAKARNARSATLYGTTKADLLSSPGPVPIAFSLDDHPPSPRLNDASRGFPRSRTQSPASPVASGFNQSPSNGSGGSPGQQPIPRPNFFPKKGVPRPRSRSFSGFSVNDTEPIFPPERSQEEGNQPKVATDVSTYHGSLRGGSPVGQTPSSPGSSQPLQSRSPSRGPSRVQRPTHVPSPLSLPAINNPESASLTLPNGNTRTGPPSPNLNATDRSKTYKSSLRQVASSGLLRLGGDPGQSESNGSRQEKSGPRTSNDKREGSPTKPMQRPMSHGTTQVEESDRDHSDLTAPSAIQGGSTSPSPMGRSASLRSKLSMPTLRTKNATGRPSRDGQEPHLSPSPLGSGPGNEDEERIQVKDMEFELVKPVLKTSGLRHSDDNLVSQVASPETDSIRSGMEGSNVRRTESPAFSPATAHPRPPNAKSSSVDSLAGFRGPSAIQLASIEAHRVREQKWMSIISNNPSSQARKSKKVKRLLMEGVPSSVRGKVWGHVTDSQARRMENLFAQLVKKAPKQIIPVVQQDVERCFPDHPHLQDPQGSLANVLLAYTAMVPDIRYRTGLTRIAGHLLLQAPDEDAFWIFVAVMDAHLRGYYHATNTGQFEIDGSLFQSLVESTEPELAQVLFNDYGIQAVDICRSWFSCLFAGVLPPDHLYRVWDVLFYEGSIYLFRVALSLIILCKRPLMALNTSQSRREAAFDLLNRPPLTAIPQDAESFLSHTFNVRVRDDDLRKQRTKREAQWKKDRLAQR